MHPRLAIFTLVILAVQLVRCGDDLPDHGAELPEVIYDGGASDEALEVVWPKLASAPVAAELQLTAPQGTIPAGPPPAFAWSAHASLVPEPRVPGSAWPLPFGPAVAQAHLPPVTGTVVLLEIQGATMVRVFTDRSSWTPAQADWDRITGGAAREITVRLYSAYLNENVLEEGPFRSASDAKFQVEAP